jgi:hypothetical protein
MKSREGEGERDVCYVSQGWSSLTLTCESRLSNNWTEGTVRQEDAG